MSINQSNVQYRSISLQQHAGKKGTAARTRRAMRRLSKGFMFNPESAYGQLVLNNTLFNERIALIDSIVGVKENQVFKLGYLMTVFLFSPVMEEKKPTLLGKALQALNVPIIVNPLVDDVMKEVAILVTSLLIATPIAIKVTPVQEVLPPIQPVHPLVKEFVETLERETRHLR